MSRRLSSHRAYVSVLRISFTNLLYPHGYTLSMFFIREMARVYFSRFVCGNDWLVSLFRSSKSSKNIFNNQHSQKTGLSQLIFHRVERPNVRSTCQFFHLTFIGKSSDFIHKQKLFWFPKTPQPAEIRHLKLATATTPCWTIGPRSSLQPRLAQGIENTFRIGRIPVSQRSSPSLQGEPRIDSHHFRRLRSGIFHAAHLGVCGGQAKVPA